MYVKIARVHSSSLINAMLRHSSPTVGSGTAFTERQGSVILPTGFNFNCRQEIKIKSLLPCIPYVVRNISAAFISVQLEFTGSFTAEGFYTWQIC